MLGAHVSIKNSLERCDVLWEYDGSLSLIPKPFQITPGFRNLHEAQSFAMAGILPLLALVNETIVFEEPVPIEVADFWYLKLSKLVDFYSSEMSCKIYPVSSELVRRFRGKEIALFMGCGADSLATLGLLLDRNIHPHLLLIEESAHKECFPGNLRSKFVKQLAQDFKLNLTIVRSNLWFYGLEILHRYLKKEACINILNRSYTKVANTNINRGFKMFFSAIAGLPESIGKIILSSSLEDRSEWCGICFNYKNTLPYIDLSLETMPWETKVSQYAYLLERHPEFLAYQKTCINPGVQWCGKCASCSLVRCLQIACEYPKPINALKRKPIDRAFRRMLESACKFYKGSDPQVLSELNFYSQGIDSNLNK